jgi:hypothetical protein
MKKRKASPDLLTRRAQLARDVERGAGRLAKLDALIDKKARRIPPPPPQKREAAADAGEGGR